MMRGAWTTVIRLVDRPHAEGTPLGWGDQQLLSRFGAGRDEAGLAFEAIMRRHGPKVLETCRRVLGGAHHATEDAFQATFVALARRAGSLVVPPNGSLGPWLLRVVCGTARNVRVAAARRAAPDRRAAGATANAPAADPPEDEYRILHEEVDRPPEKYRAAVVLCDFEGLTHDQAAESLRWPVGTVRGDLARARDQLRTRLVRRGLVPAVAAGVLAHPSPSEAMSAAPALLDASARAASNGVTGPKVVALARTMTRGLLVSGVRRAAATLIVAAIGIVGVGLATSYLETSAPHWGPPIAAAFPAASGPLDAQGDPLPEGAAARIGTTRLNHGRLVNFVAYSPGRSILASAG